MGTTGTQGTTTTGQAPGDAAPQAPEVSEVAGARAEIVADFLRRLDVYLPEQGPLKPWKISEIEAALQKDMRALSCAVIQKRLGVDPSRLRVKPRCPQCGRKLMGVHDGHTHKQTIFGPLEFTRTYGYCHSCRVAFSPSGQRVGLRQGLL